MTWVCIPSTYSPERAGDCSQTNCLDTLQLRLANSKTIPEEFFYKDSLTEFYQSSQFGMTPKPCEPITQSAPKHSTTGEASETISSLRAVFHVLTSHVPEKALASMESNPVFGERWQELLVKYDRDTCSWKTHRSLWEEVLPEYSVTLPRYGMMLDGVVYQRKTSGRPIGGTGSGWLPTPSSCSYGSNIGGAAGRVGKVRSSLETMARHQMWPTPQYHDSSKGYASRVGRFGTKHGARNLNDEVAKWPTPTVQDGNGRTHHNQRDGSKTKSLLGVVKSKPTMTCDCGHTFEFESLDELCPSCDSIRSGSVTYPTPTSSMVTVGDMEQARFAGNDPRRPDYETANKSFPTPCATDADKGGRGELLGFVRGTKGYRGPLIPTPTASDSKCGPGQGPKCQGGENLRTSVGGSLNADWVELLLGWPNGWSSLDPLTHINADWYTWPSNWERGVPRVTKSQPNRTKRLKAIGNGQVPICAALAWVILTTNHEERDED